MKFKVLIERDEDGCYVATVPALPGCISQGRTEMEANRNIKEAIELHLECLAEDGVPLTTRAGVKEVAVADAGAFQLAAGSGWDPAADVDGGSRIISPGRSHDPASRNHRDRIVTTTVYDPDRWYSVFECGASALPPTFL